MSVPVTGVLVVLVRLCGWMIWDVMFEVVLEREV